MTYHFLEVTRVNLAITRILSIRVREQPGQHESNQIHGKHHSTFIEARTREGGHQPPDAGPQLLHGIVKLGRPVAMVAACFSNKRYDNEDPRLNKFFGNLKVGLVLIRGCREELIESCDRRDVLFERPQDRRQCRVSRACLSSANAAAILVGLVILLSLSLIFGQSCVLYGLPKPAS